jgi:large subunit ribosomal protein L7Ae
MKRYQPESKADKKERRTKAASEGAAAGKPVTIKYGINHITWLVENQKAKLIAIANDVEPIELVIWLPALCRKMGVPYCIVKGKSTLGRLVYKKNATAVALTEVRKEDVGELENLSNTFKR